VTARAEEETRTMDTAAPLPFVRIHGDSKGASHFADGLLPFALVNFAPPAPPISATEFIDAKSVGIISSPPGWHGDWHPAPRRQLMFMLSGELEVQVSDGETRRFGPGAAILVEDTSGRGHVTSVVSKDRAFMITVALQDTGPDAPGLRRTE
jgi:hypothetical protein